MSSAVVFPPPMTLAEFLLWDSGDDRSYELVGGTIVAMAPTSRSHGVLVGNAVRHIGNRLASRSGCTIETEAGLSVPERNDRLYIADLAVSCDPLKPGEQTIPSPLLIVEVLSPSTEAHDRKIKLPDYRSIPSVREIVLIDQERTYVEVYRRLDEDRWLIDLVRGEAGSLRLESIDLLIELREIYRGVPTKDEEPTPR